MPVPMIPNEDHEVLGTEFCSGYVDAFGKWNTGFYCPQVDVAEASYCCGTPTFKYCCSGKELGLERTTQEPDEELFLLIIGVGLGVTIGFSLLTLAVCFFLPGCMLSKKSKRKAGAALYRTENESSNILTQRGASFSESGSIYSIATTNNSSNATSTTSGNSAASDSVQVLVKNPYGISSVMRTTLPRAVTRPTSFGKDTTIWESEDTADSRSLLSSLLLADSAPTSVVPMQHTVNSTFTGGVSPRLDMSAIERPKVLQLEEGFSSTKF